jgi:adenylate cyclase
MTATLHLKSNPSGSTHTCGEIVTIGRGKQNHIVLEGLKISRSHALVRCMAQSTYFLVDMGSTNGTLVNDKRVLVPCSLSDCDEIRIGDHVLVFHQDKPPEEPDDVLSSAADETIPSLGGRMQKITVLVTDIRDFTPMSEQTPADLLAQILGRWFRASNDIVERNGGIIDKFIGDAVMARWVEERGGTKVHPVISALKAVHEMQTLAARLAGEFPDFTHQFRIGAGINTGEAVLGNVGANSRRDYTALGDAVNLAFRFESATKGLKKDIVLGPDSYRHLPESIWESTVQSIIVKGKEKPISVFAMNFDDLAALISTGTL